MMPNYGISVAFLLLLIVAAVFVALFIVLLIKKPMAALLLLLIGVFGVGGLVFLGTRVQYNVSMQEAQSQVQAQVQRQRMIALQQQERLAQLPTTQDGKLWVNNWLEFNEQNNWQGFRTESSDTCVNATEARQEAIANAAHDFTQQVLARYPALNPDQIIQRVTTMLESGQFIDDQSVKTINKSYGTLWKHYLLINTSPENLDAVAQQTQQVAVAHETHELTTWGSLLALCGVIVLVYLFLNAATRGYFVWRLRAAALLVVIVAALVVMMFA